MKIEIEKPVIPQFVADWIEEAREERYISTLFGKNLSHEMYIWSAENTVYKEEMVATAFLYGYEVEKEPLYYAKIKGWELSKGNIYWNANVREKSLFIQGKSQVGIFKTKLTKYEWNELGINDTNADFEEVE